MLREYIWNGEMDYGWEDLSNFLMNTCHNFIRIITETTSLSHNFESKFLLSDECMERFEKITSIVAEIIKDGNYYEYEDNDCKKQNALKLNGWVLLGSLTESVMQMFLAFYIDDYRRTKWQQWDEFEKEKVQIPLFECIQHLVDDSILSPKQAKSIKLAIKETVKEHTKEHKVQKVMLDELIQLYLFLDLINEDELCYLRQIQSNRNGIHSFESREIGTWRDLQFCTRFFCYLLEWIEFHLPDCE